MKDYKLAVQLCLDFLKHYKFLSDMYIIEFFTNNHWKKLPLSWQSFLLNLEPPDIAKLLLMPRSLQKQKKVCPLSLLAFKQCTQILSISRTPKYKSLDSFVNQFLDNNVKHAFLKHVKPKKQHEIFVLSQLVASIFFKESCSSVIDVGSGQGHLSRLLSLGFNFPVTSLECEDSYLKRAQKFDDEAKLHISKTFSRSEMSDLQTNMLLHNDFPTRLQFKVLPSTSPSEFAQLLKGTKPSNKATSANIFDRCLLTGLHACGDLSASMIRLFKESPDIHALVSVGCCYMKLSVSDQKSFKLGTSRCNNLHCYPLSNSVKSIADHHLSYKSRELSCHAIEDFQNRLMENGLHLKMHCYRAVLEYLIRQSVPGLIRPGVQTVKKAYLLPFEEYVEKAYKKLNLDMVPGNKFYNNKIETMLKDWKKVLIFFTLALMVAPVIESAILLDRVIYLLENNCLCELISVFDPLLSPRCFAIVAKKPVCHK